LIDGLARASLRRINASAPAMRRLAGCQEFGR
jgi:hypothetical protein